MNGAKLTVADIGWRILNLKIGHSITVDTDRERRDALNAGRVLGKRIATRKTKKGKFTITVLPGE